MTYDVIIDGKNHRLELGRAEGVWSCRVDDREVEVDAVLARPDVLSLRGRTRTADDQGPKKLTAPMPGKVVRVLVSAGAEVAAGAGVMVVEAMKMQNEIKSPKKGTIQKILVSEGAAVNAGDVLAIVE